MASWSIRKTIMLFSMVILVWYKKRIWTDSLGKVNNDKECMFYLQDSQVNSNAVTIDVWHSRLGHTPKDRILSVLNGFNHKIDLNTPLTICSICSLAKLKRQSFNNSCHNNTYAFDLLHLDVWGKFPTPKIHGQSYFLIVVDDFKRNT